MVAQGLDPATTPVRYYLAYAEEVDDDERSSAGADIEVLGDGA